jgi:hypothetical protein
MTWDAPMGQACKATPARVKVPVLFYLLRSLPANLDLSAAAATAVAAIATKVGVVTTVVEAMATMVGAAATMV